MERTSHYIRWCANVILGFGSLLALNESETFIPNFIGVACFYALILINRRKHDKG